MPPKIKSTSVTTKGSRKHGAETSMNHMRYPTPKLEKTHDSLTLTTSSRRR
jgi:hypothetical protein